MKKVIMRQYWRIQQSQAIITLGFWTATLTLLVWPYVSWRFDPSESFLTIPMTYVGLVGIAFGVLSSVLLIGFAYDVTFGLWRDHITINQERNPFTTYKLNPTWGIVIAQTNEILRRIAPEDEDIQRSMSSWKDILGDEDPFLFYLDEEARKNLEESAANLEEF